MPSSLVESTQQLHAVLEPLSPEERKRVIRAALTLLGDEEVAEIKKQGAGDGEQAGGAEPLGTPAQAQAWMKKHSVSMEKIEQFLHVDDGKAKVIELPPGAKTQSEKTRACYLMAGLAALFTTGETAFSDAEARGLCNHFGCYDHGNHSKYLNKSEMQ